MFFFRFQVFAEDLKEQLLQHWCLYDWHKSNQSNLKTSYLIYTPQELAHVNSNDCWLRQLSIRYIQLTYFITECSHVAPPTVWPRSFFISSRYHYHSCPNIHCQSTQQPSSHTKHTSVTAANYSGRQSFNDKAFWIHITISHHDDDDVSQSSS